MTRGGSNVPEFQFKKFEEPTGDGPIDLSSMDLSLWITVLREDIMKFNDAWHSLEGPFGEEGRFRLHDCPDCKCT